MVRKCGILSLSIWGGIGLLLAVAGGHAQGAQVVRMPVSGTIDLGLAPFTNRVIREAEDIGATALILHINTPGGRVDAAIQMRDGRLNARVDTVAFIAKEASSAGALIALAGTQIYLTGGAVIGAATPIDPSGQKAGEKEVSAIRKLFRATAEQHGRPPEVVEAMVDEDVAIPGLVETGKRLTLTTQEALQWKVADGRFDTLGALLAHLGFSEAHLVRAELNWAESLVRALTHPVVSSLRLSMGMLALLAELLSPGVGIPGAVGLIGLALCFGSHYLVGLAGWEEARLIGVGLLLRAAELLILPGFGAAGVLGMVALCAGLFLSFLGRYPAPGDLWRATTMLLTSVAVVAVGGGGLLLLFPGLPVWSRLNLRTQLRDERRESGLTTEPPAPSTWLGAKGIALTPLRPAGTGLFQGERLDIISEGGYVAANTPMTIVRVEGARVVVRPDASHPP
jgi:membrane-bound serine protease (ClpP class)